MAKALATLPARTLADGGCALKEAGHAAFVLSQLGANLPPTFRQLAAKDTVSNEPSTSAVNQHPEAGVEFGSIICF
ncbi:hypothetical protein AAMO2058_000471700 [Amorphochlora amoebiformis]